MVNVATYERKCKLPFYVASNSGKTSKEYLIRKGWSSFKRTVGKRIGAK